MKRATSFCAALLALVAGCTNSSVPQASKSSAPSEPPPGQSPTVPASPSRLPTLVLRADQSELPAPWNLVFIVPFGAGKDRLLYSAPSQSAPTEPTAFAVAPDGSFWIADPGKSRVAHFSRTDGYLDEIRTAGHYAEDLAFSGTAMYVLLDERAGLIAQVSSTGTRSITVNANGRALMISPQLYPDAGGLVARSAGYEDSTGQLAGPEGYVRVDVSGSGRAEVLPGLPIGRQTAVNLDSGDSGEDLNLTYVRDGVYVAQPIRFRLLVRAGSKEKRIPGIFGPDPLPLDGDVPMYVMVSPARPGDQERYGGSRWFLRMGRSPVLWERLPDPGVPDEAQRRHIAAGPDGTLYLMVLTTKGAQIYRRP